MMNNGEKKKNCCGMLEQFAQLLFSQQFLNHTNTNKFTVNNFSATNCIRYN